MKNFFKSVNAEIKTLTYPTRKHVLLSTIMVLSVAVILSVLISLDTSAISEIFKLIINKLF